MAGRVCIDASIALMLLLPHDLTTQADALWSLWTREGVDRVTAPLFFAEVTSVLREHVYRGILSNSDGDQAFAVFTSLRIRGISSTGLQPQAWSLAKAYNRPRAYDAQYLAVAAMLGCEMWTADRRLVNAVNAPWIRWVGDHR
ncbi:MAG TPA: type II toxin-antitoxin system VapC family toxin [bacterium]|nr:type II toxin-antitoxin system VapC family toxin [bacterium]